MGVEMSLRDLDDAYNSPGGDLVGNSCTLLRQRSTATP